MSTKSSATTPSSRCAPGLRISRKPSSCGSVVGSDTRPPLFGTVVRRSATTRLADRLGNASRLGYPRRVSAVEPADRHRAAVRAPQRGADPHHHRRARPVRRARCRRDVAADDRRHDRRHEGRGLPPVQDQGRDRRRRRRGRARARSSRRSTRPKPNATARAPARCSLTRSSTSRCSAAAWRARSSTIPSSSASSRSTSRSGS